MFPKFPFKTIAAEIRKWAIHTVLAALGLPDIEDKLERLEDEVSRIDEACKATQYYIAEESKENAALNMRQARARVTRIRAVLFELAEKQVPGSFVWKSMRYDQYRKAAQTNEEASGSDEMSKLMKEFE